MLRIPSNCRWKDSVALSGSITLHWVAELIAFSSYRRMPFLAPIKGGIKQGADQLVTRQQRAEAGDVQLGRRYAPNQSEVGLPRCG
jgi:hypothetical protein